MSGLIYATTSRGVFEVDPKQSSPPRKVVDVHRGGFWRRGHKLGFFGLTTDNAGEIYFAERVRCSWATKKQRTSVTRLSTDDPSARSDIVIPDCSDVHQIALYEKNLFLTDTAKNRVLVFDLSKRRRRVALNLGPLRKDKNHINALHASTDRLRIGLNNRSFSDSVVIDLPYADIFSGSETIAIDPSDISHRLYGITDTHDLEPVDDRILISASKKGQVFYLDSGEVVFSGGGWVRGLTSDANHIYIGESPNASRKERHNEDLSPTIKKVAKHDLEVLSEQKIDSGGQLNDLLFLDEKN